MYYQLRIRYYFKKDHVINFVNETGAVKYRDNILKKYSIYNCNIKELIKNTSITKYE